MGVLDALHTAKTELFKFLSLIYNTFILYFVSVLALVALMEVGFTYYNPYSIVLYIQSNKTVSTAIALISIENLFMLCSGYLAVYVLIKAGWFISQSYTKQLNYEKVSFGALAWQLIFVISSIIKQFMFIAGPVKLTYIQRPLWQVIINLVITLIILPIQCYVEEYIFRGPIAENPSITILVLSSIFFSALHICNPEIIAASAYLPFIAYFLCVSFSIGTIAYLTETIDYSFGAHFINNFTTTFLFSSITSAFSGLGLFLVSGHGITYVTTVDYFIGLFLIPVLEGATFTSLCVEFDKVDKRASKESFINKSKQAFSSVINNVTDTLFVLTKKAA